MGAISELYRGRISAPTNITVRTEEYYRLIDEAEKLTEAVNKLLADDALQTFHDLQETQHLLTSSPSFRGLFPLW